jgi:hypothetical protein
MTDPHHLPNTERVEHDGCQNHLSPSGLEWLAVVAQPKQRPTLIMASDRSAALAEANGRIDQQRASDLKPE